ncbi:MAG TPA: TIGR03560 family F420-dependent LLM class oxidoreductase [Solirubrobacteraceae bacterium]|jgi:F420-dependent oxidoreductase-like protein|nr:TIGR03560 family F420-dependent LLM class oxidoreductase [Solirubrobacteraceae bacterium]
MNDLRFGIHAGQQNADFESYLELWRSAEEVGLDWASVFDHFMPIQADPTGPCFEGMTLLAAMAAHTERLRCGIIVTGVTYRHPAVLANMAVTIDHISGGRLELGIGAAWYGLEHEQYGVPMPRLGIRFDMLDEQARILKLLWSQERSNYQGAHFTLTDAMCEPGPLQPTIPLWVGGSGEKRTLRVVAESGDGWNTFLMPEEDFDRKLAALAGHCADFGRDPAEIRIGLVVRTVLRESEKEAREAANELARRMNTDPAAIWNQDAIVGTPEMFAERLEPMRRRGVGDFLMMSRPPGDRQTMEALAREVAPEMRRLAAV